MAQDVKNDPSLGASLVAYYKLDESSGDASDATGNGNTGINSSVTFAAAKINNGAVFNGSAYFTIADNSSIKPASAISFGGWVNITSTSSYQMLIAKGENSGDTRSYELRCYGTTTQMEVQMRVGGAYIQARSTTAIGTGSWVHVIFTRDGTTQKIYINGVSDTLETNVTQTGDIDYSTDSLWLGQRNGGLRFNGKLDEIAIWSKALTQDDIDLLYNGGDGIPYEATGGARISNFALLGVS